MLKNKILIVFLICSSSVLGQVLPLDSVISSIEKNNPQLQQYDYSIKAFDAYAKGAKSWMPPQAGAGLYQTDYKLKNGMLMLSVEQMIPNPGKQKRKEDYLLSRSSVAKENQRFSRNQLISQAKGFYYEGTVIEKKKLVLKESQALLKFIIEVSEMRYTYQQETLDYIYRAKANLHKLENEGLMLESELKEKRIMLNTLMNRDKNIEFTLDTTFSVTNFSVIVPDPSVIDTTRSDIRTINQNIKVMQLNQRLEQGGKLPDFGIRFDHMQGFGMMPNQFSLMGMITIPIVPWASKEYRANAEGMSLEILAMEKEKEAMRNEISGELQALNTMIQNKKSQLTLFKEKIIPALEKSYETTRIAYEQNTGMLMKVLDAWETLQMTKMQYLELMQELVKLRVDYEKAIEQK